MASASAINTDSILHIIEQTEIDSIKIRNYYELFKTYQNTDLSQSIKYADLGTEIARRNHDSTNIGIGLFHSGSSYSRLGLYKNALDRLNDAKDIFSSYSDTNYTIRTLKSIGNIFWFKKDFSMALRIYKQSLLLSNAYNNFMRPGILTNMAVCYNHLNNLDSSFICSNQVLEYLKTTNNRYGNAIVYLNLGHIYMENNYLDSANLYLNKSLQFKDALPNVAKVYLMSSMAQYYSIVKNLKLSNDYLDSAYHYTKSDKSLLALKEYYQVKFEIDTALRNYESAIHSQLELNKIKDTINNKDQEERLANYKALYEMNLKEQEIVNLKSENKIIKLDKKKKQGIVTSLILIICLSMLAIFFYRRSSKIKSNSIQKLQKLNKKLSEQQYELETNNKELVQILEQLNDTQEQLIQSEKLASIGVLATGVAHEINNPLNYINGGLMFLNEIKSEIKKEQQPDVFDKYTLSLNIIKEGITKANKVVRTLGKFAFKKDSKIHPENLNTIIESAFEKISFKISSQIDVSKELNKIPLLYCDKSKVKTIVIQLLLNAIDAANNPNTNKKLVGVKTFITNKNNLDHITLSITNEGRTIENDQINKVFDPFFTTKDPDKGYGLGLSITYNLVKELNGEIMVQKKDDLVEFIVMFPIEK